MKLLNATALTGRAAAYHSSGGVRMPSSTFVSLSHPASAAAFAVAVGDVYRRLRLPLRAAAAIVVLYGRALPG